MTDHRLRALLEERVADLEPRDLSAGAWQAGRQVRQRRRAAALAGAAAAVLTVAGITTVLEGGRSAEPALPASSPSQAERSPAPVGPTEPTGSAARQGEPYQGAPVWWAPPLREEGRLPSLGGSPLGTGSIDLSPTSPVPPGTRAVAVFQVQGDTGSGRVVVLDDAGTTYALGVGRLDRVTDEEGNVYSPLGDLSLSPDGRRVFFRQDSTLEVHDLTDATWRSIETPDWLAEGARWLDEDEIWVPGTLGAESGSGTVHRLDGSSGRGDLAEVAVGGGPWGEAFGPARARGGSTARTYFLADPVPGSGGASWAGLDAVVARTPSGTAVLVFALIDPDGEGRWKGCCPVAGWLDAGTVLVQSRSAQSRLLAWRVGTGELFRVADVVGWQPGAESFVVSVALP